MAETGEITQLLSRLSRELQDPGEADRGEVLSQLMPLVYGELKMLARSNRYRWRGGEASPGTTSLVHEAYAKLARHGGVSYENRKQFFCIASRAMRSILIDNARRYLRQKRGGGLEPLPLDEDRLVSAERSEELLALDDALNRLDEREPDLARIVECRTFGGLTVEETAEALDVSSATVKRRWSLARAWLYRDLNAGGGAAPAP
jgi:RNA polymerase sigma factor (TIGR02999 family)